MFDKGGKNIQWSKDRFFIKWCWENWSDTGKKKKMKLDNPITPYTRINSKWIKSLNGSCETIKILDENIDSKTSGISHSNIFSDISPQARETTEKNKQMGLHQTKKLLHSKRNH